MCAIAIPAQRPPGARWPSRASIGGACSAMNARTRSRNAPSSASVGRVGEALTTPTPRQAARDSSARYQEGRHPLVKTRRSSWCSGYSQVNPIPPDSCMHSSMAAVVFAADEGMSDSGCVSAVRTRSSSAVGRGKRARRLHDHERAALTSKTSSSTRRCCTAWKLAIGAPKATRSLRYAVSRCKGARHARRSASALIKQPCRPRCSRSARFGRSDQHARRPGRSTTPHRTRDVQHVTVGPALVSVGQARPGAFRCGLP